MVYINFFKPGRSSESYEEHFYISQLKQISGTKIFDRNKLNKFVVILISVIFFIVSNASIYFCYNFMDKNKINALQSDNAQFNGYISQMMSKKSQYDSIKKKCDNVYNISMKTQKWSVLFKEITLLIPYDTVITNIETISSNNMNDDTKANSQVKNIGSDSKQSASQSTSASGNQNGTVQKSSENTGSGDANGINNSNNTQSNQTNNVSGNTNTQQNSSGSSSNPGNQSSTSNNSSIQGNKTAQNSNGTSTSADSNNQSSLLNDDKSKNNVIVVEGKTLSMVNLTVFLSKLNNSKYFSKAECKSGKEENGFINFKINIYIKEVN